MYFLLRVDQGLKQNHKDVLLPVHLHELYPSGERNWTDIEPEDYSPIAYPVSKQLIYLLSHGHIPEEEDGAIELWRWKDYIRNNFLRSQHWSDDKRKSIMARGGGNKKRFQYCTDPSGQEIVLSPSSSRSLRTQSHWSYTSGQCVNSERFLRLHLSCRMCNQFTLHHEFRISPRRTKFWAQDRRYSSRLWILRSKNTDPEVIDWKHRVMLGTIRKVEEISKHGVFGWHQTGSKRKDFKFLQTRSNAIILYDTLPAHCIPKAIMMETGEIIYQKVYVSIRPLF